MKITSVFAAIKYVWKCRKTLSRPRNVDILIFDKEGAIDFFDCILPFPPETGQTKSGWNPDGNKENRLF